MFFRGITSSPRNHYIQEIFRHIGLCERAGSGVLRIMAAVKENSLAMPQLNATDDSVELNIRDISWLESLDDVDKQEKLLLANFQNQNSFARVEVENKLDLTKHDALKIIKSLIEKDYLISMGSGRNTRYSLNREEDYVKYDIMNQLGNLFQKMISE